MRKYRRKDEDLSYFKMRYLEFSCFLLDYMDDASGKFFQDGASSQRIDWSIHKRSDLSKNQYAFSTTGTKYGSSGLMLHGAQGGFLTAYIEREFNRDMTKYGPDFSIEKENFHREIFDADDDRVVVMTAWFVGEKLPEFFVELRNRRSYFLDVYKSIHRILLNWSVQRCGFSEIESEIMKRFCLGMETEDIKRDLDISEAKFREAVWSIIEKTDSKTKLQAVYIATANRFI